jgi:hypothetical protein
VTAEPSASTAASSWRARCSADLVHELRLVVAPTRAREGRRLFDGGGDLRKLELVDSDGTDAGALLLTYRL